MGLFYVYGSPDPYLVGRDPGCDLVLSGSFVSRKHLCFLPVTHDVAVLEVSGTNGAIVDGVQVSRGYRGYVRCGERIIIGGYEIVWIGRAYEPDRGFMRGLSRPSSPDLSPIEIEGPPQRKMPEKPSLMLAAGPALTMAIPILLGAGRSMAILSSVFAALWAAANVLGRMRKQKAEEKRRQNTYMSYLRQCEESIRHRLLGIVKDLNALYPEVYRYLREGGDPFILWASRPDDDGTVSARIGKGPVASPLEIIVPKERFDSVDDSLKSCPAMIKQKYTTINGTPVIATLSPGGVSAFILGDCRDCDMLAAFILQLAASYDPESLKISMKTDINTMRYFMWAAMLPHFDRQEVFPDAPGMRVVFTDDIAYAYKLISCGVITVMVKKSEADLPSGVSDVINRGSEKTAYDSIPRKLCFSYAGQMAGLWGVKDAQEAIPPVVPFGKLFDAHMMAGGRKRLCRMILDNYEGNDITAALAAPIGISEGGKKTVLDIHEKAAGPHGLIAGTTGSGKSELLTTLILSLAMEYPPDKLAFLLIDYKGGGMSGIFTGLPHVLGSVSNLSRAEAHRAMTALGSENIKRQKIFAAAGVNNINDYIRLYEKGKAGVPIPHVVIIVDEFAELRREEPEFMDSLISISQIGRSLGMHLILATQKPAGVVDERIRSNSRFRIALRLVDRSDSMDMLRRGDAVDIRECGRAFLQVGNDEIFECFQSGYAMGPAGDGTEAVRFFEDLLPGDEIIPSGEQCPGKDREATWFEVGLGSVISACAEKGYAVPEPLWMPPLPQDIRDDSAYAVYDDPFAQTYRKAVYDQASDGHVLITGRSGSGKSELAATLIRRIRQKKALYVIDHGGGRLGHVRDMNCCGGYVPDDRLQDIARMTGFISGMLSDRRKKIRDTYGGFYPVFLVLDGFEQIRKNAPEGTAEQIAFILAMGAAVGIYVVATSLSVPDARTLGLFDTVLFLGDNDTYTVASSLKVSARDIPEIADTAGRGIGLWEGRALEFQTVMDREDGKRAVADDFRAPEYPHVPDSPQLDDLLGRALRETPSAGAAGGTVRELPVCFEYESGRICSLPLWKVNCILICGKPYSGRHTFLFVISVIAARYGISCTSTCDSGALVSLCRDGTEPGIVLIPDMTGLLDGFYACWRSAEEEDELAACLENPSGSERCEINRPVVIGIIDNEARMRFAGRKVMEAITKRPFGFSFGGSLDENRIMDFSYMSFNRMQKAQKCHNATILKYDENSFSGHVITPGIINVDNSKIR